jgi:outer membrane protein assembly factor BamB
MRIFGLALLLVVLTGPLAAQETARSWPHWRGPARDGVSPETDWSSVGQSEPLWSVELGLGYSNVSIRDGRLLTLGFDEAAGQDRLFCLDARTGAELWRKAWPAEIRANFHGGGTLTTPSIDGGVVFVTNREGRCMALRAADGSELWQRNYTEELGLKIAFHGFSASPLVLAERLVLAFGGKVFAVDKDDGDLQWQTDDHGDGGYSNLVPFELDGRTRVCAFLGIGPLVLDAETGKELHRYPWQAGGGGVNVCTPIVMGRRIFISTAYDQGSALLELGDEPQAKLLWRARRMRNKVSGCTLWDGHIWGFDESLLKCFDLEGNEKWSVRGMGMGSVAVAGGRLIVLTSKGELVVATASPQEFRELSRRKVLDGGVCWTTPVLLDGLIYCRNSLGRLVCLDHREAERAVSAEASLPEPAIGTLPPTDSLFAEHARLIGGDKLRAKGSLHLEGTIEIPGDGITKTALTVDLLAPDRWRLSYDLGRFGTVQHAFDGEVGWVLDPFYGDRKLEGDELRERCETRALHAPIEWRELYPEARTEGRGEFAKRQCWVVAAKSRGGATRRFYFDTMLGRLLGHDGEGESMVVYHEWRAFDGIEIPTKTTIVAPDTGAEQVWVIDSAAWDTVGAEAWARSAEVKRLLRTPEQIEAENAAAREKYARYLGAYSGELWSGRTVIRVVVADGGLMLESEGWPPTAMREAETEHRFVHRSVGTFSIEFRIDSEGAVRGFTLTSDDKTFELTREG